MFNIQNTETKRTLKTNAILNAIRQSSSVVLPLITFPYVSRILGSIQYGRYSFSASIVSYFYLFSTYGISNYAVREGARIRDNQKKISNLASDLLVFNIVTAIISYILLGLFVIGNAKIREYSFLIFIQSLCIVFTMLGVDWINIVFEDFFYITVRYIALQIIALILIFYLIKSPADVGKYCLILVTASYGGNLLNLIYVRKYVKIKIKRRINLKHYYVPLSMLFINSLATMVYVNSDITMLGFFQSDEAVGIYSFASRIYNVLKHLINSIIIVSVPRLAHICEENKELYTAYVHKIFKLLMFVIFPIVIIFSVFSDSMIYIAGGKEYISGSESFKILMIALIFALLASVFTNCILIINRLEKYCLISTIISAVVNVELNLHLLSIWGISGAAITTSIAEASNLCMQSYFARKKLGTKLIINKNNFYVILIASFNVLLVCILINYFVSADTIIQTLFKISIGCLISAIVYILTFILNYSRR